MTVNTNLYQAMKYRLIGPHRGGRVVAVAGDPEDKRIFYFGSTGGGVWKTTDGGNIWENVSDGYFNYASVGALTVSHSDPNVIYAGMGETTIRGNVSRGDGVYKSTDAGKTWRHCGLADSQNIGSIVIHPSDPDTVYVAAFGHVWGPNQERGLYRSRDGGKTWEKVLYRDEKTGALDIAMDPANPRVLYVSFWEARRTPYSLESGGPGSSIYMTKDGGDNWEEITDRPGMPEGVKGKIGLAVAAGGSGRVWAIIEAEQGGVYRSDDDGDSWKLLTSDANLIQRPWYWMHIFADPRDPNTVWVPNFEIWKSVDGGSNFEIVSTPHPDNHGMWFDPANPERVIMGHDGGACVSYNGGLTWSTTYNQPTAEFYHVTTDSRTPYRVYGPQQDNTTISVPSRSNSAAINMSEWYTVGGGESGYIAVRPDNPNIVFAGSYQGMLTRYDHESGLVKNITVWPENWSGWEAGQWKYRFQWTAPTMLSPHNPDTLYTGGNHLFRSKDQGDSWEEISPDLTRADPETLGPTGGPVSKDMTGAETYATVFAAAESPVQGGVIWAGSDDGLVNLTRNHGQNWTDVTPPELPDWALISIIEPSPHDPATAYVAATRYKSHDDRPYLFKTHDYGESWAAITEGIPEHEFTRVIREDPEVQGLLYAGTERGMYVSFDDGEQWHGLQLNLPVVPIHDFVLAQGDLVVATHGRSFWILDDVSPLRQIARGISENGMHLFQPRSTYQLGSIRTLGHTPIEGKNLSLAAGLNVTYRQHTTPEDETERFYLDSGNNPPDGVIVHYYLPDQSEDEVTLTFLAGGGEEIRTFTSKKDENGNEQDGKLTVRAGANRFVWNMQYPDATAIENDEISKGLVSGPKAPPGSYQVRLTVGAASRTEPFEILPDPRVSATQEDFQQQFELQKKIWKKLSQAHEAVGKIRTITAQVEAWEDRTDDQALRDAIENLKKQLADIEGRIVQRRAKGPKDRLKFPVMLNYKLSSLMGVVASAEGKPTQQSYDLYSELESRVDEQIDRLQSVLDSDLDMVNTRIREAGITPVTT